MSVKMVKFDIYEGGKKVGTQTHPEEFAPVLQSGQTAKVVNEEKVKEAEPSVATVKATPAAPTKGR